MEIENRDEWYKDEVECSLKIALILMCIILCPMEDRKFSHLVVNSAWIKLLSKVNVSQELVDEMRAIFILLESYTGATVCRKKGIRINYDLGFAELNLTSSGQYQPIRLSPHEDILLLRMSGQHYSQENLPQESADFSLADAARGGGDFASCGTFDIKENMIKSCVSTAPPPLAINSEYPSYCGVVSIRSQSKSDGTGWPVSQDFSMILSHAIDSLLRSSSFENELKENFKVNHNSAYSLLKEWRYYIFPFRKEIFEGFDDIVPTIVTKRHSSDNDFSELSSLMLNAARCVLVKLYFSIAHDCIVLSVLRQ